MPTLRKNAKHLTPNEKRRYVNAVKTLKNTVRPGATISIYDEIAVLHRAVSHLLYSSQRQTVAHAGSDFASWHRKHLHWFETELQRVDPHVTLVYWDWNDPDSTDAVFTDDFMGQWTSGPLTGVFKGMKQAIPLDGLVTRQFQGTKADVLKVFKDQGYDTIMNYKTFKEFTSKLQLIHNVPHVWFGGDMGVLDQAGNDPVFFLHHANVDRLWDKWQKYHGQNDTSAFEQFIMDDPKQVPQGMFPRPSTYGTALNDYMWPWDHGKSKFTIEATQISDGLAAAIAKFNIEPPVSVGSMWSQKPFIGYDVAGPRLVLGRKVAFDPTYMESVLYPFTVPRELSGCPFEIETYGDPRVVIRLYGPALCEDCYGPLAAEDDGAGLEGPKILQTLDAGRYNVLVYPDSPTLDIAKYELLVAPLLSPGEELPYQPLPHPEPAGPLPELVAFKTHLDPSAYIAPKIRAVGLLLDVTFPSNVSGHGITDYYSFEITKPGLITIDVKNVIFTTVFLFDGPPPAKYLGTAGSSSGTSLTLRRYLDKPGRYWVSVYNTSFAIGKYSILVKQRATTEGHAVPAEYATFASPSQHHTTHEGSREIPTSHSHPHPHPHAPSQQTTEVQATYHVPTIEGQQTEGHAHTAPQQTEQTTAQSSTSQVQSTTEGRFF